MTFYSKDDVKHFDTVLVDGKIQTLPLLEASKGIVEMISMLGKAFTPVKSDITGNIEKLQKKYDKNKEAYVTINAMLDDELATKSTDLAKVGGLWLMRALKFMRSLMLGLVKEHKEGNGKTPNENLKPIITAAYEETLQKYHNFIVKRVFSGVAGLAPYRKDLLQKLALGKEGMEDKVIDEMDIYVQTMIPVLDAMAKLYKDTGVDDDKSV